VIGGGGDPLVYDVTNEIMNINEKEKKNRYKEKINRKDKGK